jgi:hypothetical protein
MTFTHLLLSCLVYNASGPAISYSTSSNATNTALQSGLIQHYLTACLLMSLVRDRLSQLVKKLFTFTLITICAWKIKKQRKRAALVFIVLNFIFFLPILFTLILPAALLSAPILPLFTFPLYLFGFPRIKRFWPQRTDFFSLRTFWNFRNKSMATVPQTTTTLSSKAASAATADANFYAQLMPELLRSFKELVRSGSIGSSIRPECFYLSRFQDRILWIQVLEASHAYMILNVKGLELQETSCHTVEAQYVDDTFDLAFENPTGAQANSASCCSKCCVLKLNPRPFNCMRPRDILVFQGYSDAKSTLIGILDNPESLSLLVDFFPKIMHYFLVRFLIDDSVRTRAEKAKTEAVARSISNFKTDSLAPIKPTVSLVDSNNNTEKNSNNNNNKIGSMVSANKEYNDDFVAETTVVTANAKQNKKPVVNDSDDDDGWSDTDSTANIKMVKRKNSFAAKSNDAFETDPYDFDLDKILGNTKKKSKDELEVFNKNNDNITSKPVVPLFPNTGFAQTVENPNKPKQLPPLKNDPFKLNSVRKDETAGENKVLIDKEERATLAIPSEWLQLMNESVSLTQSVSNESLKTSVMTRKWLERLVEVRGASDMSDREAVLADYEANFWASHYKFLLRCSHVVGVLSAAQISANLNLQAIFKLYKGDLPWSPANEKLTKELPELQKLLVRAFRFAFIQF